MEATQARTHAPATDVARLVLRTPADIAELERRDRGTLFRGRTIYEALQHAAERHPEKTAILQLMTVDDESPIVVDYATYLAQVERAANLFKAASGKAAPVVAVVAPFVPEGLIAMFGGATAGVYVPINPFLEFEHVAGIMNAAKATVLVIGTTRFGAGVWDKTRELAASVPTLQRTFLIGAGPGEKDDFATALAGARAGGLDFEPAHSGDSDCAYMHTGGTTAVPKLVRHTHGSQLLQGWLCGTAMESAADAVIGHAMPNFHVGGAIAVGVRTIVFGQTVLTLTPSGFRNPGLVPNFWKIVERYGMTNITSAPTTAAAIHAGGGAGPKTLRHYTTGGGPLSPELGRAFHRTYGLHLREVWGGTEFHAILSLHYGGDVPPRLGSCGRIVPFHQVMSAILDGQRFVRKANPDERGIIIACGPCLTPGFVDPAAGANFYLEGGPGGHPWATTGDVGAVDDDGFIWIYGREKDVIIRGGHNIDSALIDDVLVTHPAVLYAAAVGQPCASKGELPMAFVQLRPGAQVSSEELLAYAKGNIKERAAVPVAIHVIDAIPLTAVGKVSKPHLRKEALRMVAEKTCAEVTSGLPVSFAIEEPAGRLTLVIELDDANATFAEQLEAALSPFTFHFRIERSAAARARA